jgi:hypothetical protein
MKNGIITLSEATKIHNEFVVEAMRKKKSQELSKLQYKTSFFSFFIFLIACKNIYKSGEREELTLWNKQKIFYPFRFC